MFTYLISGERNKKTVTKRLGRLMTVSCIALVSPAGISRERRLIYFRSV
jgi:hypothetical protein